jgi:DNA-binding NarL/FixJ family response regulator
VVWHPGTEPGLTILYNVLVVDDDEATRLATVAALRSRPTLRVVAHVATARAAIGRARSIALDLIVLDDRLGVGPRGVDIAPSLRRLAKFAHIVLFSSQRPETPVAELDGIDAVVVKPDYELLVETSVSLLSGGLDLDAEADAEQPTAPEQA